MNDVLEVMKNHRSIRGFSNQTVDQELVKEIIATAQFASTSNFIQAYSVIQVQDNHKRGLLAEYSGNQSYVKDAPVFLVFCADLYRIKSAGVKQGIEIDTTTIESFLLPTIDTTIFAQNVLLGAESRGVGGVYIGGIRNNPERVSQLLELPELVVPLFGMCLGYPEIIPDQKPRLPLSTVLHHDIYQKDHESELEQYDQLIENYYTQRTNGVRADRWTTQISTLLSKKKREHLIKLIKNKGFLLE